MAFLNHDISAAKITEKEINEKGVYAAADVLTGSAAENKRIFDRLVREVVAPKLNGLIDELKTQYGAENIGFNATSNGVLSGNVQGALDYLKEYIDNTVVAAGAMSSFNGRNGIVVPEPGDYPIEFIGAAPEKYGIGELETFVINSNTEFDDALIEQIDSMGNQYFKRFCVRLMNSDNGLKSNANWYIDIFKSATLSGEARASIVARSYASNFRMAARYYNGTLYDWEWVNYSLNVGEEYRTIERYDGRVVYVKAIDCGPPPQNTGVEFPHEISGCHPISVTARLGSSFIIPYVAKNGNRIDISATGNNIVLHSNYSASQSNRVIAVLKYYKS